MAIFEHLEQGTRTGGPAASAIIILHGYGSNAERSMASGAFLGKAFPDAHIYAPYGTFPHTAFLDPKSEGMSTEPSPGRFVWYHRYSDETRQEGLLETGAKLDAYVEECRAAHGLERSQVAVIGISQGAITVLNCLPRFDKPIGAAIAHSGYLFAPDALAWRNTAVLEFKAQVRSHTPTSLIHGTADYTLPWQTALEASNFLAELETETEFHLLSGLKHAVVEERSQTLIAEYIRRHVYAKTAVAAPA